MTATNDISSTFVRTIDADSVASYQVLSATDPMRSVANPLSALGLDDRAMWTRNGELSYSLIWRFGAGEGHGRFDWDLEVGTDSRLRTTLTLRVRGRGSDETARTRVLRSWLLIEGLAHDHIARLARMLDDYADADAYSAAPDRLRAVV